MFRHSVFYSLQKTKYRQWYCEYLLIFSGILKDHYLFHLSMFSNIFSLSDLITLLVGLIFFILSEEVLHHHIVLSPVYENMLPTGLCYLNQSLDELNLGNMA